MSDRHVHTAFFGLALATFERPSGGLIPTNFLKLKFFFLLIFLIICYFEPKKVVRMKFF